MTFARRNYERKPQPLYAPMVRTGSYGPVTEIPVSAPKPEAHRNPHLLAMARGKPCLLRVMEVCNRDPSTVVACHSNLSIHGKGGARKADDCYSVWGCRGCHAWLDQGPAPAKHKAAAFMRAHLAQVNEWRAIASSTTEHPKDKAAAQWALDRLNATPQPQGDQP